MQVDTSCKISFSFDLTIKSNAHDQIDKKNDHLDKIPHFSKLNDILTKVSHRT